MESSTHLHFNSDIGKQKPESIRNRATACPFCDREQLTDVIDEEGSILLLKNKYPVLEETLQTVLIETDECDSELSEYTKEHLHKLFAFGFKNWLAMEDSGEYQSVLFYKNHGPFSGGTIRHPHMQIVGLHTVDYQIHVQDEHFEGIPVYEEGSVSFNISTKPRVGFFEFNIALADLSHLPTLADMTQVAVHYTMNHFHKQCNSYNLFFYRHDGRFIVKVVPRFVTSPLFVGFSIPQVSNRIHEVQTEIQSLYYV